MKLSFGILIGCAVFATGCSLLSTDASMPADHPARPQGPPGPYPQEYGMLDSNPADPVEPVMEKSGMHEHAEPKEDRR